MNSSSAPIHLSIVIPAYNESSRLGQTLREVLHYLEQQPYRSELIVVDDGSLDQTTEIAKKFLKNSPHQLITFSQNQGKGAAVKAGVLKAQGRFVLFSDADLSTPISEIEKFFPYFDQGYDVVIGSRGLQDSQVEIRQNIFRQSMGKIFNWLARLLTFKGVKDSQCGFKCFTQKSAKILFEKQQIHGFGFDVEIVYLAQKMEFRLYECPVIWRNSPNSRVKLLRDPLRMFFDILRIWWIHRSL